MNHKNQTRTKELDHEEVSEPEQKHYYLDRESKIIYVLGGITENTGLTYMGGFTNPDVKMVVSFLLPGERGYTIKYSL